MSETFCFKGNEMLKSFFVSLGICASLVSTSAAASVVVDPVTDGSHFEGGGSVDFGYLLVSNGIHGIVKFESSPATRSADNVLFSLNPYGLPLFGPNISLYGFNSQFGEADETDNQNLILLGNFVLPDLGYGENVFYDVTSFVRGNNSSFFGFNIQADGTNVFSSMEINYGNPSQLTLGGAIGAVPEPESWALMIFGFGMIGFAMRQRKSYVQLSYR